VKTKNKLIAKTKILCTDQPGHPRHEVRLFEDGTVECDCPKGVEEGKRLGAAVALGAPNMLRRSCAGLIAYVAVGLPRLAAERADVSRSWGGWKDAYLTYNTNALVREAFSCLIEKRDAAHGEMFKVARRALVSCGRYRDGMSQADFSREVAFIPDAPVDVGQSVALFASDRWTVPLQAGWLESVGKAKPVIDGRFIVGVSAHPGFVFAIDGSNDDGFTICEFALVNGKLGKVAPVSP